MPIKEFTPEQRRVSLALAHRIRRARAVIRSGLQTGSWEPEDVLALSRLTEPTIKLEVRAAKGLRVRSFLMALNGVGPITAAKVMDELGINYRRKLGGLTTGQRGRLIAWLQERVSEAERSA